MSTLECEKRYTTYERLTSIDLNVVKRSGRTEKFDREKLKAGINRAVKKRAIGDSKIDEIIDDIELKLLNRKATEIRSTDIGKMVLTRLKKIDEIGYILFSAVYNGFNDIDDLSDAIKIIKTS